jgi:hypothetical protein
VTAPTAAQTTSNWTTTTGSNGSALDYSKINQALLTELQRRLGNHYQLQPNADCGPDVNPGSFTCTSYDSGNNIMQWTGIARNGRWSASWSGDDASIDPAYYPHRIQGTY